MRKELFSSVFTLAVLTSSALASAATTYYASPSGSGSSCSQAAPCSLGSGINKIAGGDTLLLADGTYSGASVPSYGFSVTQAGTANGWTTIAAAPGAVPVIVGSGPSNNTGLSATASYVQFVGIVVQGFNTGFANRWTGTGHVNDSNGNVRFINCIADGNGKNGIAFQSATGVLVRECIVAHNGGDADYASSGVDLFGAAGTYTDNVVERNVSFENADTAAHSDGSGFIVDDVGTGATFVNNLGFRNGGSCIRLTQSTGTHLVNNSCYADGLDTADNNPASPGEIFFSAAITQTGVLMVNNIAIATGSTQDKQAIFGAPAANVSNNYTKNDGTTSFWQDPTGTHPDYRLASTASELIDKGVAANAPTDDLGFDAKCIAKGAPSVVGVQSWYAYSIDYAYIRSLGGVAGCFAPGQRSGTPDIGAYEYRTVVGSGGSGGVGGNGGAAGVGGGGAATGGGGAATGGGGAATGGGVGGGGAATGGGGAATGGGGAATGGGGAATGGGGAATGGGGAATGGGGAATGGGGGGGGLPSGGAATGGGGMASSSGGTATGGASVGGAGGGNGSGALAGVGGSLVATGGATAAAGMSGLGGSATTGVNTSGAAGSSTAATAGSAGRGSTGPATVPGSFDLQPVGGEGCSCRVAGQPLRRAPLELVLTALVVGCSIYRRRPSVKPRR